MHQETDPRAAQRSVPLIGKVPADSPVEVRQSCSLAGRRDAYPTTSGLLESRVEGPAAGGGVLLLCGAGRFAGAEFAVHGAVFPFGGERGLVADAVQLADDLLEVDRATTGAAEIPSAAVVAEV